MRTEYYNKGNDIITINFGKVKHSRELKNVNIVIDFDKDNNIVGLEIFDFMKIMDEGQKEIDKIFSKSDIAIKKGKEALKRLRERN